MEKYIAIVVFATLFVLCRWARANMDKGSAIVGALSWLFLILFGVVAFAFATTGKV